MFSNQSDGRTLQGRFIDYTQWKYCVHASAKHVLTIDVPRLCYVITCMNKNTSAEIW